MYCCKTLSVLSLYEGDLLGVVDKLYFSKYLKKLVELEIVSDDGAKLVLPTKNIYKVGKNALIVKNTQAVSIKMELSNLCLCPVDSKAYSITGEYLGIVKEITFNEKFITQQISLDNNIILLADNLASCGKNTIIFHTEEHKVNVKKFEPIKQPKIFKTTEVQVAKVLPIKETKTEQTNISILRNSDFLIGRRCSKNIYNFNNEILIKENGLINKKNLKEIKKFGKLRELMLYSK